MLILSRMNFISADLSLHCLLKISYLVYLLVLLIIIYLSALVKGGLETVFYGIEFFAFLVVLFVPTIGIFARKLGQFSKKREGYNYFFTSSKCSFNNSYSCDVSSFNHCVYRRKNFPLSTFDMTLERFSSELLNILLLIKL
jgi:hypothetical protein